MRLALATLLLIGGMQGAGAQELSADQTRRFQALTQELRCLVCQNQNIADSNAPLAEDLRQQVRTQIAAGRSDREIMDYMTQRYGDFVLYRPRLKSSTLLLWLAPVLLVLVGVVVAWRMVSRRQGAATAPVDQGRLKELLEGERKP